MVGTPLKKSHFEKLNGIGLAWVRECLENGEVYSKLVLSNVDIDNGTVLVAIATREHQEATAGNQPLSQGVINQSAIDTELQLAMLLDKLQELEVNIGPLVVMGEDNLVYPSSEIQNLPNLPHFQYVDRYLFAQSLSDIQRDNNFDVLALSNGYPLNAFVVPQKSLPSNPNLSTKDADNITNSVIGIINSAYDGETYTLWVKDR